jgi:hypothetical protein
MFSNRSLWHLCVWFGIALLGAIAWWATGTALGATFGIVAGVAAFYFVNRTDHAQRS